MYSIFFGGGGGGEGLLSDTKFRKSQNLGLWLQAFWIVHPILYLRFNLYHAVKTLLVIKTDELTF
jgi:hypothetical protein